MPLGRHTLSIETGKMAKQADGAVVVRLATPSSWRLPVRRVSRGPGSTSFP